jgi:hypothetical protein
MAQITIWCPAFVRDKFDAYSQNAPQHEQQRASSAFEAFHSLFADDYGVNPPIVYSPAPPVPANAVEVEIRIYGVRFLISVESTNRYVWLEGISL